MREVKTISREKEEKKGDHIRKLRGGFLEAGSGSTSKVFEPLEISTKQQQNNQTAKPTRRRNIYN